MELKIAQLEHLAAYWGRNLDIIISFQHIFTLFKPNKSISSISLYFSFHSGAVLINIWLIQRKYENSKEHMSTLSLIYKQSTHTHTHTVVVAHLPAGFWLAGCQKVAHHLQRWSPAPWGCRWCQESGLRWWSGCCRQCCASARRWAERSGPSCSTPGSPWFVHLVPREAPIGPASCWHLACALGRAEAARRGPVRQCVSPRGRWADHDRCCWPPWRETRTQSKG